MKTNSWSEKTTPKTKKMENKNQENLPDCPRPIKPLLMPWPPLSSARFCAARAFLNQYTTLLTSNGFRPLLDSSEFNWNTYDWICCRDGCGFSWNQRCNFGSSISGSKLVRIRVFWFGYCEWTDCMAGWMMKFGWCAWAAVANLWLFTMTSRLATILRLRNKANSSGVNSSVVFCELINGKFWLLAWAVNWPPHHCSKFR